MRLPYQNMKFMLSVVRMQDAPVDEGLEVAFAGRSNAGKSSGLNVLASQNNLARTSKTPGRTRELNYFEIDSQRRIVDLPGYGYAKVSRQVQNQWRGLLDDFLQNRQSLQGLMVFMDIRHPMSDYDLQLIDWCEHRQLPLHILLTKADKLGYGKAKSTLMAIRQELTPATMPATVQTFSALKKTGLDEAYETLDHWFQLSETDEKKSTV
ncbi:MAG TPA: YihA family ribosome biogenesis GTP-binding protein [Crenotrichaceae bacterium]|nr:YihA family ribosome biogenesis GTP-binding protein [Crenotrichaceae bacterium]